MSRIRLPFPRRLAAISGLLMTLMAPTALMTQPSVTPDEGSVSVGENITGHTVTFDISNQDQWDRTYTVSCWTFGSPWGCSAVPSSLWIPAFSSAPVTVTYNSGGAGTGSVHISATDEVGFHDSGMYSVTVEAPRYTVDVTPDGGSAAPAAFSGVTQPFTVQSTGNTGATYDLGVLCAPPAANSCSGPGEVTLAAGAWTTVNVTYQSGAQGSSGTVRLVATYRENAAIGDDGSVAVTVGAGAPASTIVSVAGTSVDRDLCLTIAVESSAAFECGDLRVAHALPSVRTVNKARTPTLLYNSRHAHVAPLLAAHVTLGAGAAPTKVTATLWVQAVGGSWINPPGASGEWVGADLVPGRPIRIALSYDAAGEGTRLVDYRIDVVVWDGATPRPTVSATGQFVLVDRSQSPLGAGWWLAGLDQLLFPSSGGIVWVGGDGSTRRYTSAGASVWTAQAVDRPDTLKWDAPRSTYVQYLPHGVKVEFDSFGRHVATVNRLGFTTTFSYDGTGRLRKIGVPRWASDSTYVFTYDGTDSVRITSFSGTPRVVMTTIRLAAGVANTIRDPDGTVTFEYDGSPTNRRIKARIDRRGARTRFAYATGHVLELATLDSALNMAWSEHRFAPVAESRGLSVGGGVTTAVVVSDVHTKYDGPRAASDVVDHTTFWTTGLGAPWKIQNAVGAPTVLTRGDARYPALVTEMRAPNGFTTWSSYDARGNPRIVMQVNPLGDTRNARTFAEWDQRWDFARRIKQPEGELTALEYDALNGNRLTQEDGRGASSRVSFRYYTSGPAIGLLRAVALPGGPRDSLVYDPALLNLSTTFTPRNYLTEHLRDQLGRDSIVRHQLDTAGTAFQRDSLVYDWRDRVVQSMSFGPLYNSVPAERVIVRNSYDAEGNVRRVERESDPKPANVQVITTQWVRDTVDRWTVEVAPDGKRDSTVFDAAGNAIRYYSRRRDGSGNPYLIAMAYDAMNRLVQRDVPPVFYPVDSQGIASETGLTGLSGIPYGNLTIAGETTRYWFNPTIGLLDSASNPDAKIARGYLPNGLMAWDSLRIRTYAGTDFAIHRHGLASLYDRNGRRIRLEHPEKLAGRFGGTVFRYTHFAFDTLTGQLAKVTDPKGNQFTYTYNDRNEMTALGLPWGGSEVFTYDADGQVRTHQVGTVRSNTYAYDARARLVKSANSILGHETLVATHSGLGNLVGSTYTINGTNAYGNPVSQTVDSDFAYDALGHMHWEWHGTTMATSGGFGGGGSQFMSGPQWSEFDAATGRITLHRTNKRHDAYVHDEAGNVQFSYTHYWDPAQNPKPPREDRASFYGADDRLKQVDYRWVVVPNGEDSEWKRVVEVYRYDPLGRRVLVRTFRSCRLLMFAACRMGTIRRTIWDGDQELYEIQMPGDSVTSAALVENDTGAVHLSHDVTPYSTEPFDRNPFFGRVAYTYGLALDQPLSITRMGYESWPWTSGQPQQWARWEEPFTIVPHWNFRGEADVGVFASGSLQHCRPLPPDPQRCVQIAWPLGAYAYQRESRPPWAPWHGGLLEQREDGAHTLYKRNRYYDPATGRFTQEDPIGLAGGLNLYGFANGDPVNFSDPFGLMPCPSCPDFSNVEGGSSTTAPRSLGPFATGFVLAMRVGVDLLSPGTPENNALLQVIGMTSGGGGGAVRVPRNAALAGQAHPKTGIPFNASGYPDFSSVAIKTVNIRQTGNSAADFKAANEAAGLAATPRGYTWHHHEDMTTMQLVPRGIHQQTGHTGGAAKVSNPGTYPEE